MSEALPAPPPTEPPRPQVEKRGWFGLIWLVPLVAVGLALFLGYRSLSQRGPEISIQFNSADGITAGQTQIRHKAVTLGTVGAIFLSDDMKSVTVRARMRASAAKVLTDQARFWVVRPRFNAANISGLDTLISGSYIELDPGAPDGKTQTSFRGLENPPAVRSDEPGRTFVLNAPSVGQLASGSQVFFRDVPVGEVIDYDVNRGKPGVTLHLFVRAPFDSFVARNSHFWNVSGASIALGAEGVQLRLASLQALISGGVAFDSPSNGDAVQAAAANAAFPLYATQADAENAGYRERIPMVSYFTGSVRGLARGSAVELNGIQIGQVTRVELLFDPAGGESRVAVHMEVQPERILRPDQTVSAPPLEISRNLVAHGMRVQLQTSNYLTGQLVVAFTFPDGAAPASVSTEGDEVVLPNVPGSLDSIQSSLSAVATKLAKLPLEDIARNLNDTLQGASATVNDPNLKRTIGGAAEAMTAVQSVLRKADNGVDRVTRLFGSADAGYGENSEFRRELTRLLAQFSDTARSVQLLADYLNRHPESLVFGHRGP